MSYMAVRNPSIGLVGFIFRIVGLLSLVVVAVLTVTNAKKQERCTQAVPAIVVELQESYSRGSNGYPSVTFYPVVEYEFEGQIYKRRHNEGTNPPAYYEGDEITLLVNPEDPHDFYIEGSTVSVFLRVIFGALGVIMLLIGFAVKFTGRITAWR